MADLPRELVFGDNLAAEIELECERGFTQRQVALTYAIALGQRHLQTFDASRANEAILKRWPRGLERVKAMAWKMLEERRVGGRGGVAMPDRRKLTTRIKAPVWDEAGGFVAIELECGHVAYTMRGDTSGQDLSPGAPWQCEECDRENGYRLEDLIEKATNLVSRRKR